MGFAELYASIPAGIQPDVINPPLAVYHTGSYSGVQAGTFGNAKMYNYTFPLPTPFQAAAGTKYWVQIEASQSGIPDWDLSSGTGGNGKCFLEMVNVSDVHYAIVSGDTAFSLK